MTSENFWYLVATALLEVTTLRTEPSPAAKKKMERLVTLIKGVDNKRNEEPDADLSKPFSPLGEKWVAHSLSLSFVRPLAFTDIPILCTTTGIDFQCVTYIF